MVLMVKSFFEKCLKDCFENGSNDVQNIYTVNGKYSQKSLENVMKKINKEGSGVLLLLSHQETSQELLSNVSFLKGEKKTNENVWCKGHFNT